MNTSSSLLAAIASLTVEDHSWLSPNHCAGPVLDLLGSHGWTVVTTPEANVHATPRARTGARTSNGSDTHATWRRGIVWSVADALADAKPWFQDSDSPVVAHLATNAGARPAHISKATGRGRERAASSLQPLTMNGLVVADTNGGTYRLSS
ncbi:hypothetical protein ACFT7S_16380 [Streptomyces sp. NPDC057136]|uniref:hypothetical protein n=1 Tax=Streptomyces sp. NPDC057136 TaxID=3346029 RepID=UPI00363415B5